MTRTAVLVLLFAATPSVVAAQTTGCRTGAAFMAEALLRTNPLYAALLGDTVSYRAQNSDHFGTGGDAVRCASALTAALAQDTAVRSALLRAADVERQALLEAANRLEIAHINAMLDSVNKVRGNAAREQAFMRQTADVLSEYPDTLRAPQSIRSVDEAAAALEAALRSFGQSTALVESSPAGTEWQAVFRHRYMPGPEFTVTAGDSLRIDPADYYVACQRRGAKPLTEELHNCRSRCRIVCQAPKRGPG